MEGDHKALWIEFNIDHFNPLPPHGGRRNVSDAQPEDRTFQSTPSAWRETTFQILDDAPEEISIHSLRMEGDRTASVWIKCFNIFQSTPSAWRETIIYTFHVAAPLISIHSLRMEGDQLPLVSMLSHQHFNPLPPHGGRLHAFRTRLCVKHFNPLPPHGGRQQMNTFLSGIYTFQSTPSAWRETYSQKCI